MLDLPPLYLMRHGQTNWNRDRRIQGQMESELTETGRGHAARQGEILAGLPLPAGICAHVSPLLRTRQTADIAVAPLGVAITCDDRLKEVSLGAWEGGYYADLLQENPDLRALNIFDLCLASPGETLADLQDRIGAFLRDLRGPAIIVSHGIALTVLRGLARGLDHAQMRALDRGQGYVIQLVGGVETVHR